VTTRKVAGLLQSLPRPGSSRETSIVTKIPERFITTPQEMVQLLNEEMSRLRSYIAELDGCDYEELRDQVAYFRLCESERDEIVDLMRTISKFQLFEPQPAHYEDWVPWAYEKIKERQERRHKEPQPEPDYGVSWRFQKSKRTLVPLSARGPRPVPEICRSEPKHRKQVRRTKKPRIWFLRVVCQRLSLIIRLQRKKK